MGHDTEQRKAITADVLDKMRGRPETGDLVVTKRSQVILKVLVGVLVPVVMGAVGVAIDSRVQMSKFDTAIAANAEHNTKLDERLEKFDAKIEHYKAQQQQDDREQRDKLAGIQQQLGAMDAKLDILMGRRNR